MGAFTKWNDFMKLKRMPGQRSFNGEVIETRTDKKQARIEKIRKKKIKKYIRD